MIRWGETLKLNNSNVSGKMYKRIKFYLYNRKAVMIPSSDWKVNRIWVSCPELSTFQI